MSAQYFAKLDENNIVVYVAVVTNQFMQANPQRYLGTWVETFFDTDGKTYAGIGYEYLEDEQDFRTVQPYPSWTWANKLWNPPTPMPTDGGTYYWNEEELAWDCNSIDEP
jgi:hypothetical protein